MIVRVTEWYAARSTREQRLILLMLVIALPLLAWLLVVQPLGRAYDAALDRHLESVDRNGRVRALAEGARSGSSAPAAAAGQDLGMLVTESAGRAGLTIAANESAGAGSAKVTIAQAPSAAAMQWLRELESGGVRIEELRMAPADQGLVSVTVRLARPGA